MIASIGAQAYQSVGLISSNINSEMTQHIEAVLAQDPHFQRTVQHYLVNKTLPSAYSMMQNQHCLIVTVGIEALETVLKNKIKMPILSILTREYYFTKLLTQYHREQNDPENPIFVIYLDQPLSRQFDLLKTLFRDHPPPRMGILLSHEAYSQQSLILTLAKEKKIIPTVTFINEFDQPITTLNNLFGNVDVILAMPDPKIYHANSVRGILLTAFHHRMPIIGYSRTFVNNGALACVYSNAEQISEQAAKTITMITQNLENLPSLPKTQYPEKFDIAINYQVATSLGFSLPDQKTIKSEMDAKYVQ